MVEPVLAVRDLKKHFPIQSGLLRRAAGTVFAVDGVSFTIAAGETLGLVGESGCGKSTVGRTILRLIEPTEGSIKIDGSEITKLSKTELRPFRRQMQIIFQDPFSSLDPRMSAGDIVAEPMRVHRTARGPEVKKRVAALFDRVGLRKAQMDSYPHQFSGGQRQRIGIARALALQPKLIIGDEPVSALDVSIQAQVLNLMMDLQSEMGLAYLFISHNMAVVEHISHRIAVMYLGRIVEHTDKRTLFTRPLHPYTESLLLAVPVPDPASSGRSACCKATYQARSIRPRAAISTRAVLMSWTAAAPRRLPCARLNRGNGSHVTCASRPCSAPAGNRQSQRNPGCAVHHLISRAAFAGYVAPARRLPFFSAASRRAPARCSPNIAKTIRPKATYLDASRRRAQARRKSGACLTGPCEPRVTLEIPDAPVAQLDRAPDFESGGQGFEIPSGAPIAATSLPALSNRRLRQRHQLRPVFGEHAWIDRADRQIRQSLPHFVHSEQWNAEIAAHGERMPVRAQCHLGVIDLPSRGSRILPSSYSKPCRFMPRIKEGRAPARCAGHRCSGCTPDWADRSAGETPSQLRLHRSGPCPGRTGTS